MNRVRKIIYIIAGIVTLLLGILGIFTPGVPTTPLLMLSFWFFSHSWLYMHNKMAENRLFKKYINKKSVNLKTKILAMVTMVSMVSFSTYVYWDNKPVSYTLIIFGIVGFFVMLKKIKVEDSNKQIE